MEATAQSDELPFSPAFGCLLALVIGLFGVALSFQIIKLVAQGELRFGGPSMAPNRIWLVQEADTAGFFISTNRVSSGSVQSENLCVQTRVRSFLWRRQQDAAIDSYCLCYEKGEGGWRQIGSCPSQVSP